MAYLQAEWAAHGITQTSFARENKLDNSMFSRWAKGATPREIEVLRLIADAMPGNVTLIELLIAGKFIRPEEVDAPEPTPTPPPDVDRAIDLDPRLTAEEKDLLRTARELGTAKRAAVEAASVKPLPPKGSKATGTRRVRK